MRELLPPSWWLGVLLIGVAAVGTVGSLAVVLWLLLR